MENKLKYLSKPFTQRLCDLFDKYAYELDDCKSIADAYDKLDPLAEEILSHKEKDETVWMMHNTSNTGEIYDKYVKDLDGIIMTTDCCDNFAHDYREKLIPLVNSTPGGVGLEPDASDNHVWTMTYFAGYIDVLSHLADCDKKTFIDLIWYDILGEQ